MIKFKAKTVNGEVINSALSDFTFPAGEAHIKREERRELEPVEIAVVYGSTIDLHNDLFKVMMWSDYLTHTDPSIKQVLVIPYFPGARADRGYPHGASVYASMFNNLGIEQIVLFDPHSDVIMEELKSIYDMDVRAFYPADLLRLNHDLHFKKTEFQGIIAPDAGAVQRAAEVALALGLPLFRGTKKRNFENGKLTSFEIEPLNPSDNYLIVDDICDGGGTFIGLAQASGLKKEQLSLYVSHGIFSGKAVENLANTFNKVLFTNSYHPDRIYRLPDQVGEFFNWKYPDAFHRLDVTNLLMSVV